MTETPRFNVLLTQPAHQDPMGLAKALAAARKTPVQDQMIAAKNSWGIVAEFGSAADAENLVRALKPLGIESTAIPAASLSILPEAKPAGTIALVSADRPILIAAAAIPVTTTTTKMVKEGPSTGQKIASTAILLGTGIPVHIGGKARSVEKKQEHHDVEFSIDLVFKDPLRRFRIEAEKFDYAFLKERKLYQVLGNFKLLLGDLVKAAPEAWQNQGTRVLLENKPIVSMGYGSRRDLEREAQWLLTLMSLNPSHGPI